MPQNQDVAGRSVRLASVTGEDFEILVEKPVLPSKDDERKGILWWKSLFVWEKTFILIGFLIAVGIAVFLRSQNLIGLGVGSSVKYRIQQTHSLFANEKAKAFRRFPALTLCSNGINASACHAGQYQPCDPDPSILSIDGCYIHRYSTSTHSYTKEECPDWKNVSIIASAEQRYCITMNNITSGPDIWSSAHPNDHLRIFLRAERLRSEETPWSGGFAYLHTALTQPEDLFAMDNSYTHFGIGRYHRLSYDVRHDFSTGLKAFRDECLTHVNDVEYDLFIRESADLEPTNSTVEPNSLYQNTSSLTVLSLGFHGHEPALVCTYESNLNSVYAVLEHIAGLLVFPELGAMLALWLYVVIFKGLWVYCRSWCRAKNQPDSGKKAPDTTDGLTLILAVIYAFLVLGTGVAIVIIGVTAFK